jgi:hypothetical protein
MGIFLMIMFKKAQSLELHYLDRDLVWCVAFEVVFVVVF